MRRIPYSYYGIDYDLAMEVIKEELGVIFRVPDDVYILGCRNTEYVIVMKNSKPTIYGFKLSYVNIFSTSYCGVETHRLGIHMHVDEETRLGYFPSELGEEDYNYILKSLLYSAISYNIPLRRKIEKLPRNYPLGIKVSIAELLMGDKMPIFTDKVFSENLKDRYHLEKIRVEHKDLNLKYQACYEMLKRDLRIAVLVAEEDLIIVREDFDRFIVIPAGLNCKDKPHILTLNKNELTRTTSVKGLVHIELPKGDILNIVGDLKLIFR